MKYIILNDKMAFPKIDGYVVTEKLGSGSYSTVYKAYTKVGARTIVAIKCVDKCRVKNSGSAVDNLITEIRLLKTLQHPHIVRMHHFTWDERNIYIIMEYCCGGDLSKYIRRYGRVPEKQVLYFLQQLASALKFLSEKGVVHMDLKPHNLLLHKESDGKYILKVADFGFAQHLSCDGVGVGSGVRGSPLYMAPEMIAGDYDARVDLWSVVSLIKQAIELDGAGAVAEALERYTLSLRYLVPAAATERDALRRSALTAKLTRYMERAEEIKAYLKYSRSELGSESSTRADTTHDTTHDTTRRRHDIAPCCRNTTRDNTNSYDFSNTRLGCNPCKCTSQSSACSCRSDREGETNGESEVMSDPAVDSSPRAPQSRSATRFAFKRLFSRQNLPYLDTKDSSIADDTAQPDRAQKAGEANDACRIT